MPISDHHGFGLQQLKDSRHGLSGRIDHDGQLLVSWYLGDQVDGLVLSAWVAHDHQLGADFLNRVGQTQYSTLCRGLPEFLSQFQGQLLGHGGHAGEHRSNDVRWNPGHNGFAQGDDGFRVGLSIHHAQLS